MQMFFEMSMQNDFNEIIKNRYIIDNDIPQEHQAYFNQAFESISQNLPEIDARINASVNAWTVETMAQVDVAILRLAIAEILFVDAIPSSVSINEAVELAKKFGGDNSAKFINGILGAVVREEE